MDGAALGQFVTDVSPDALLGYTKRRGRCRAGQDAERNALARMVLADSGYERGDIVRLVQMSGGRYLVIEKVDESLRPERV